MDQANQAKRQQNRESRLITLLPLPSPDEMIEYRPTPLMPVEDALGNSARILVNVQQFGYAHQFCILRIVVTQYKYYLHSKALF